MKFRNAAPRLIGVAILLLPAARLDAQQHEAAFELIELLSAESLSCNFRPMPDADASASPDDDASASPDDDTAGSSADDAAATPDAPITFTDISVATGTASGGDARIGGEVRIMPTNLGLHFYQFDDVGALSLVTVTASRDGSGRYAAVLSRHHADGEALEPSQHTGSCGAPASGD